MQPRASIMPRAELAMSAPRARARIRWKPVRILPEAPMRMSFFRSKPNSASTTKARPSLSGKPTELEYSIGAAPVPPSPPSTVMKSGLMPVSTIALQMAKNSLRKPTQSLKPTGLPPDSSRSCRMNSTSSSGVENAVWAGGEITSVCGSTVADRGDLGGVFCRRAGCRRGRVWPPAMETGSETGFSEANLQALLDQQRPVFINFTADWCITCIANEKGTLSTDAVQTALASRNVVYMKADWTNYDPTIAEFLKRFNRNGIPLYLVYSGRPGDPPQILPQLLTPGIVIDALEKI